MRGVGPAQSYHGLHQLPAPGLGPRQEEIFEVPLKVDLQVDVQLGRVARLHFQR